MQTLLIAAEASRILRLTTKQTEADALAGKIPHVVLPNGEIRFIESELWQWLREQQIRKESPQ